MHSDYVSSISTDTTMRQLHIKSVMTIFYKKIDEAEPTVSMDVHNDVKIYQPTTLSI